MLDLLIDICAHSGLDTVMIRLLRDMVRLREWDGCEYFMCVSRQWNIIGQLAFGGDMYRITKVSPGAVLQTHSCSVDVHGYARHVCTVYMDDRSRNRLTKTVDQDGYAFFDLISASLMDVDTLVMSFQGRHNGVDFEEAYVPVQRAVFRKRVGKHYKGIQWNDENLKI